MKKIFTLTLLAITTLAITGCDFGGGGQDVPGDAKISRIKATGSMKKTHYAYVDSWDIKGISCVAVSTNGEEYTLKSSEYTVSYNPSSPSEYLDKLQITFTYKENKNFKGTMSVKDISVDVPDWDFNDEVSSYYTDIDLSKSGNALQQELQRHSFEKHDTFVKYGEVKDYKEGRKGYYSIDLIPNESKMELFFTGKKTSFTAGNREHIWASADSSGLWEGTELKDTSYIGGGSDLYHIRPTTEEINTAHGDGRYIDFDDFSYRYQTLGDGGPYKVKFYNFSGDNSFCEYLEVDDRMKGDLARIIAYVYMHYSRTSAVPSSRKSMTGYLDLTDVLGYNESKARKKLIEWNKLDPASEVEKYRNHTVQQIQGNRNPFVDYPDLMQKVFG